MHTGTASSPVSHWWQGSERTRRCRSRRICTRRTSARRWATTSAMHSVHQASLSGLRRCHCQCPELEPSTRDNSIFFFSRGPVPGVFAHAGLPRGQRRTLTRPVRMLCGAGAGQLPARPHLATAPSQGTTQQNSESRKHELVCLRTASARRRAVGRGTGRGGACAHLPPSARFHPPYDIVDGKAATSAGSGTLRHWHSVHWPRTYWRQEFTSRSLRGCWRPRHSGGGQGARHCLMLRAAVEVWRYRGRALPFGRL